MNETIPLYLEWIFYLLTLVSNCVIKSHLTNSIGEREIFCEMLLMDKERI